ncbi:MAG: hypothetical protein ACRCS9_08855 [Hyphomicrobium sp.]
MVTRDILTVYEAGADPFQVRRLPLTLDVISSFAVIYALPSCEPIVHPLGTSRTISIMPDGRYVLAEVSGHAGAVIGEPVSLAEACDVAVRALAEGAETRTPQPLDVHTLAVAFIGLVATAASAPKNPVNNPDLENPNIVRFPAARGAP